MEEIKVGEFARINKDFRIICLGIGKVVNINQNTIYIKMSSNDLPIAFNVDSIAKHSSNIIDVIEVGDYVNYSRVIGFVYDEEKSIKEGVDEKIGVIVEERWDLTKYFETDIKSIVTHEQFNSIKYEVI